MTEIETPEEAALAGFAPHAQAKVKSVVRDGGRAEVTVTTVDGPDEVIICVHGDTGWHTVDEVGG